MQQHVAASASGNTVILHFSTADEAADWLVSRGFYKTPGMLPAFKKGQTRYWVNPHITEAGKTVYRIEDCHGYAVPFVKK